MNKTQVPVTILIPAYREEDAIAGVIEHVHRVMGGSGIEHEVLIIDDGSSDGTTAAALASGARVIRHLKNRG
jgi:glycosyltransferase involved in cell wall biosynthesis